jgi:hypothetical protein
MARSRKPSSGEETFHLLFGEKLWKMREPLWSVEVFCRMALKMAVEHEELKESASGADGA